MNDQFEIFHFYDIKFYIAENKNKMSGNKLQPLFDDDIMLVFVVKLNPLAI